MRRLPGLAFSLLLCLAAAAGASWPPRFAVEQPRLGMPAILAAGGQLRVEVRESLPFGNPSIDLALERGDVRHPLALEGVVREGPHRVLLARLPDVAEGAWDLVAAGDGREVRLPGAVHVLSEFPRDFTVVQMTDLHIGWRQEGAAAAEQAVREIAAIRPALVLVSGDLVHSGARKEYPRVVALLARLDVPVICVPGNHDHKSWVGYRSSFGVPYHRVDFGDWSVLCLDSGHGRDQLTQTQLRWLTRELARSAPGRTLVMVHHPVFGYRSLGAGIEELVRALDEAGTPLVLSGHLHADAGFDSRGRPLRHAAPGTGTRYLGTASAGGDVRASPAGVEPHRGYRVIEIHDGRVVSDSFDLDGDGNRDPVSSVPTGNPDAVRSAPAEQPNGVRP